MTDFTPVIDLCGDGSLPAMSSDGSSPPEVKKQKTDATRDAAVKGAILAVPQIQAGKGRALKDAHTAARKALKKQQEKELCDLDSRFEAEKAALVAAAQKSVDERDCMECGEVLQHGGAFFICGSCAGSVRKSHEKDMTTCTACDKSYCEGCLDGIDKCAGCAMCPELTCCDLERMPCGEWEEGDCVYYHHKQCKCQTSSY